MSRLLLVRHGQASFTPDPTEAFADYDKLSPLGWRQAEALGRELAGAGLEFDRVYTGPATRHRQTAEGVALAYEQVGLRWPETVEIEDLAEHDAATLVRRVLREPEAVPGLVGVGSDAQPDDPSQHTTRSYFTAFQSITRQWARGELPPELVHESWQDFRGRVERAIRTIVEDSGAGTTVCAFTSGGPIGSTVAAVLGLGDEKALELSWLVQNTTVTELLFSRGRISLRSFNAHSRLGAADLVSDV